MSAETVIRCTNGATDVDFNYDEIPDMSIEHLIKRNVYKIESGYYRIVMLSNGYIKITLSMDTIRGNTYSKLDTVAGWKTNNQPTPFKLYYEYSIDSTSFVYVQLIPESVIKIYSGGYHERTHGIVKPVFLESRPSGIAIELGEFGV